MIITLPIKNILIRFFSALWMSLTCCSVFWKIFVRNIRVCYFAGPRPDFFQELTSLKMFFFRGCSTAIAEQDFKTDLLAADSEF